MKHKEVRLTLVVLEAFVALTSILTKSQFAENVEIGVEAHGLRNEVVAGSE